MHQHSITITQHCCYFYLYNNIYVQPCTIQRALGFLVKKNHDPGFYFKPFQHRWLRAVLIKSRQQEVWFWVLCCISDRNQLIKQHVPLSNHYHQSLIIISFDVRFHCRKQLLIHLLTSLQYICVKCGIHLVLQIASSQNICSSEYFGISL